MHEYTMIAAYGNKTKKHYSISNLLQWSLYITTDIETRVTPS